MKCYIFDIDGTVANIEHRLPFIQNKPADWKAFFGACDRDEPIEHVCDLARTLMEDAFVVYVTGRSDAVRDKTEEWLQKQRLWNGALYMRTEGDHRPDHQVKQELLAQLREDGFDPLMAFEDRDQVVRMWRELGVPCAQVAPGDF